jgi:thioredoxin
MAISIEHADDESSFVRLVSGRKGWALVDFWAGWCGPCQMLAPELEHLASKESGYAIVKVDVDANGSAAEAFGVRSIPTLVLVKDGQEVARSTGAMASADLARWVKAHRTD